MLEIRKITKIYETEGFKQKALDSVSISFRRNEFAAILGPSGSGKTTMLNIIGGLDQYTTGDLVINEMSTKKFKDSDWDSYRNHRVGFVFQNYNLITHQTILANVKLALTLSGISKKEATNRAIKALKDVGLEKHINKKPNQLSGGQMQRVAIARALVNDPEILLADEPTGALDSETSIQIMTLLKVIAKNRLVIMVTHNPELANEYSNRIITLKDGKITSDSNPYDGSVNTKEQPLVLNNKKKKTSMSFKTALSLSFNNLMTKKGRTVLVAFAGSIGIIGIALILAVSTGFQNYVDSIQEETLTSYPLTVMQESTDITSMLLSMTTLGKKGDDSDIVKEAQYITSMLSNIKANDLKSFKKYLENNYKKIKGDISSIKYSYSIDPLIYTHDVTGKTVKLNPNTLFNSIYGNSMLSSYSSLASVFTQMVDDRDTLIEQYNILKGQWPTKYDEMVIVLNSPNEIPDLLVYSLGFRDNEELTEMINGIMSGEGTDIKNDPLTFTYDELMDAELKLIMPSDRYKYNTKYDVYEDMSEDKEYMEELYNKASKLKIVGIVCAKEGTTATALSPGVAYTSDLVNYIIDYSSKTDVVKKQISNEKIDIFSGTEFNNEKNSFDFKFTDLVKIDEEKLKEVFNVDIDQDKLERETKTYMNDITNSISVDISPALSSFNSNLNTLESGLFDSITSNVSLSDINSKIESYLNNNSSIFINLEKNYVIPSDTFKTTYSGLLKGLLQTYINTYYAYDSSLTTDINNPVAAINEAIVSSVITSYNDSTLIKVTAQTMAQVMTETLMKKNILMKVGELTSNLTNAFASSFNINPDDISSAFSLNFTEDELMRVVSSMMNKTESNLKNNLLSLGYQDKEEPTFISFYFNSFDGKERFLEFIDDYNSEMKNNNDEDKEIKYSDTTGILMGSVKTIVNAVSYVLIAFVSISLVVSSIMIGIITYISVYERTKEIGILRSIGASKYNISSIFNAETFIIGLLSGLFGISISYILIPIINAILHHFTGNIPLSAYLNPSSALYLVLLSIVLTLIGGLIPARAASKKDPVEALRSE